MIFVYIFIMLVFICQCVVLFIVCSVLFFCFYLVYVLITLTDCIVPYVIEQRDVSLCNMVVNVTCKCHYCIHVFMSVWWWTLQFMIVLQHDTVPVYQFFCYFFVFYPSCSIELKGVLVRTS